MAGLRRRLARWRLAILGPHPAEPDTRLLRRVRWRLVLWSGGVTLVLLLALGSAVYFSVSRSLANDSETQLRARATTIVAEIDRNPDELALPGRFGFSFGGPASGSIAMVIPPSGQTIGPSNLASLGIPDAAGLAAARAGSVDVRDTTIQGVPVRVLSQPISLAGETFVVQVIGDRTAEVRTLDLLLTVLLVGGLGVLGLALIAGWIYASRALVPIRLSLRRQREFAANASHELRTPLAVIRTSVEDLERNRDAPVGAVGEALRDIRDEVDHLTALVGDLLLLARTDSGAVEMERLPLDLADVAAEAMAALATLAAGRDVRLLLDPEPAPVKGDPLRLRQLVTILADNAIAHSPGGGLVTVRVRSAGRNVRLDVEDQGPGVRPEDMPRIFDRFYRAPGAPTGGTGLGLAIAAWIVERHGGSIRAANRGEGGALFTVELPVGGRAERAVDLAHLGQS